LKKKIGTLISMGVVAILAITIITMVIIPVNYKPIIANPASISIRNSNNDNGLYTTTNTNHINYINNILEKFENSFTRSYLSALFAGQINSTLIITQSSSIESFSSYKLTFNYNTAQTLTVNGISQTHTYDKVIFSVSDTTGYNEINIYFQQTVNDDQYYVMKTFASQSVLFDYLETLDYL